MSLSTTLFIFTYLFLCPSDLFIRCFDPLFLSSNIRALFLLLQIRLIAFIYVPHKFNYVNITLRTLLIYLYFI